MVEKRFTKKMEKIREEVIPPELIGNEDYEILVLGWGSTYGPLKEVVDELASDKIAFLHFKQVYPLSVDTGNYLKRARKTIIFENNIKNQFGNLIKLELGFDIDERVLKYDGMPFSVEEVTNNLKKFLEGL